MQGLGPAKASKYGEHVLAILAARGVLTPDLAEIVDRTGTNMFASICDTPLI